MAIQPAAQAPVVFFNPFGEGEFERNAFLRTVGLVILVAVVVFQIVATLYQKIRERIYNRDRQALDQQDAEQLRRQVPRPRIEQVEVQSEAPIGAAERAIARHANRASQHARGEVSAKARAAAEGLRLNQGMIAAQPEVIRELERRLKATDVSKIDLNEILTLWDACVGLKNVEVELSKQIGTFEDRSDAYRKLIEASSAIEGTFDLLRRRQRFDERYVSFIKERRAETVSYFNRMELLAKNIVLELRKEGVTPQQRQAVLFSLERAADEGCTPRRKAETTQQYLDLIGLQLPPREKFLFWALQIKEALILKHHQETQFHVISDARQKIGREWGLNTDAETVRDEHAGRYATAQQLIETLTRYYTPAFLIDELYQRLVFEQNHNAVAEMWELGAVDDPDGAKYEEEIDIEGDGKRRIITHAGAAKLAEIAGLLEPAPQQSWGFLSGFFNRRR